MIIAVCDPKGIAIEAIKTILYHDQQFLEITEEQKLIPLISA